MSSHLMSNRLSLSLFSLLMGLVMLAGRAEIFGLSPIAQVEASQPDPDDRTASVITWTGAARDGRWSNPRNWRGGRVPNAKQVARFAGDTPSAQADAAFAGELAGLIVEADYTSKITLERAVHISGSVKVLGGQVQTPLDAALTVQALQIEAPGVVRLGRNSKLNLTGDGEPLTGGGELDTQTNAPNSVEYTGHATRDLTQAGPAAAWRNLNLGPAQPMAGGYDVLQMASSENSTFATAIDTADGYAYFGTYTTPGYVIKVRLSDLTRVAALTLNTGENYLRSAVIDTTAGFVYFGTDTDPGVVIKIQLSDFTRVGALTMNSGENKLKAAVIDPSGGFAYFGTYTDPGIVIKVQLSDFTRVGALTLDSWHVQLRTAVIDPAGGYAYFATDNDDYSYVVKIRLSDFTLADQIALFNDFVNSPSASVIDTTGGYVYIGTFTAPARVAKIQLSDFTVASAITLTTGLDNIRSAVIDPAGGYAYFGTLTEPGKVVQIRLSDFTEMGALTLDTGENNLGSAVIDPTGGYAYFGTVTLPAKVVQVRLSDFSRLGALDFVPGGDNFRSAVIDSDGGYAYFGTDTSPGSVLKVQLSDFTVVGVLAFNSGESGLRTAVIDPTAGYAYFGTYTNPARVVKVQLSDFTRVGSLTFTGSENGALEAVIDPTGGYAYFATLNDWLVKVRLSDFTRVDVLDLALSGNTDIVSAAIDPTSGYAYFGMQNDGYIVPVQLSDFTMLSAISSGFETSAAVADPANGYAYFGTWTTPGLVLRLHTADNTWDLFGSDVLQLADGEDELLSAALDTTNGYLYFTTNTGQVVKVQTSNFIEAGVLTLDSGDAANPLVVDSAGDYAYLGVDTLPGRLLRVPITPPTLGFGASDYTVAEEVGTFNVNVTNTGDQTFTTTVRITSANNTATAPGDYTGVDETVTFLPGETSQTVVVTINDDAGYENTEAFTLTLHTPGVQPIVPIMITDNDSPPSVEFEAANFSVAEDAGAAIITATLAQASGIEATVVVASTDGTAIAGDDYDSVYQTLTIPAGQTEVTFTVNVIDNAVYNSTKTLTLDLSNPTDASLGAQSTTTLNITNDDANVAPVAVNDTYAVSAGSVFKVAASGVLSNDTDTENDLLTVVSNTSPLNGVLTIKSDGSFTYTPTVTFVGLDYFTYRASDGQISNLATVTLTVGSLTMPGIRMYGPGWNLLGWPLQTSRAVTVGLTSIAGKYQTVYHYDAQASGWEIYDASLPPQLNTLSTFNFGQAYWITVTQNVTLTLSILTSTAPYAPQAALPMPPATYYGRLLGAPTSLTPLTVYIGDTLCATARMETEWYLVHVLGADEKVGCGQAGATLLFKQNGQTVATQPWRGSGVNALDLYLWQVTTQRLFLPFITR